MSGIICPPLPGHTSPENTPCTSHSRGHGAVAASEGWVLDTASQCLTRDVKGTCGISSPVMSPVCHTHIRVQLSIASRVCCDRHGLCISCIGGPRVGACTGLATAGSGPGSSGVVRLDQLTGIIVHLEKQLAPS